MSRRLAVVLAFCASFYSANWVHADPHVLYKSDEVLLTGGGALDVQAASRIQKSKYQKKQIDGDGKLSSSGRIVRIGITRNNEDIGFLTSAGAYFGAERKTKDGIEYGLHVGLFTNSRAGYLPLRDDLARTYVHIQQKEFGRVELGTRKGASKSMAINADSIAAATGGINGSWSNYLNLTTHAPPNYSTIAVDEANFTDAPKLIYKDNDSKANHEGNRKITYYTPRFNNGIKFGVSYIPDSANKGAYGDPSLQKFVNESGPTRRLKNLITAAISWKHKIDQKQDVEVALIGETGRLTKSVNDMIANRNFYRNPKGYNIGIQYSYDKASFVVSYGNRGKLHQYKKQPDGVKDSIFYTAGVAYDFSDKLNTSFTYFRSDNRNTLDIYSISADYKWLPGIKPYAEFTYIKAKQNYNYAPTTSGTSPNATYSGSIGRTNFKNEGGVFVLGAMISL